MTDKIAQKDVESVLRSFSRALHPRELASRLGIVPERYADLIAILDRLEQDGSLKLLPGGRVKWSDRVENARASTRPKSAAQGKKEASDSWFGTISVHPRGFAFVTALGAEHDDVFIPADGVYEAMHGDTVLVRVTGRSAKGLEGVVERVETRRDARIPGTIHMKRKAAWLEPDDSRIRGPITLVGDSLQAKDGDAAIIKISRFPLYSDELPEGEVLEILGPAGDPQTEIKKILIRESITEEHSAEALKNAEQMAARLGAIRLGKRVDLRHVPLPTIDPEDARDHDDAVWVERLGTGYKVYVAIADVSEYVRAESPLDEEARARGCTIYLPDRAIPMLPRALAGDLCSLLPEQDRFCLCVIAEVDRSGAINKFEIVEGVMRSAAKLTYGGVARCLGYDPESPQSAQAELFKDDLVVLAELTEKLRKIRMDRGALDLDLPEARVVVDEETSAPVEVKKRATRSGLKRAYGLIEELMLLANELVAQWLNEKNAPAIYRVHGKPDEEKLGRLAKITDQLNVQVDLNSLSEPLGVSQFLASIAGHEKKPVLEMLLLRSLKQAVYDIDNVGHFGLASSRYLHFTSPIRRYPDLRVHRQIKQILRGGAIDKSDQALDDLRAAAVESSKKERAAMEIEREVLNLYRAIYMKSHIGEQFDARVTGISGGGLYAAVDEPCVDVMLTFESLGLDQFELDEDELGVVGRRSGERIMLGDTLRVEIKDISIVRRTVYAARLTGEAVATQDFGGDWDAPSYSIGDDGRRPENTAAFAPRPGVRKTFRSTVNARDSKRGASKTSDGRRETSGQKTGSAGHRGAQSSSARGASTQGGGSHGGSSQGTGGGRGRTKPTGARPNADARPSAGAARKPNKKRR